MKFSSNTLAVLKWMSTISTSINIEAGNKLYIHSPEKSVLAYVELKDDVFENQIITTNLNGLLNRINMFKGDANLEFLDSNTICLSDSNGTKKCTFYLSDINLVQQMNKIPKERKDLVIEFELSSETLDDILETSKSLNAPDIAISIENSEIIVTCYNHEVNTFGDAKIKIGNTEAASDKTFMYSKTKILKLPEKFNYNVKIYEEGLTKFEALNSPYNKLCMYCTMLAK